MSEDQTTYAADGMFRIRIAWETGTVWLMQAGDPYFNHENQPVRSMKFSNEESRAGLWSTALAKDLLAEVRKRWHQAELV